jgi:hypothetical protein
VGINRNSFEAAFRALRIWSKSLNAAPENTPQISAGSGAPTAADPDGPDGSIYHRTDGAAGTTLYARVSGAWSALLDAAGLASTATGLGASLIGIEDAAGYTATTDAEAAIAELYTHVRTQLCTVSLTAGAEAADVIAVTVNVTDLGGTAVSRAQRVVFTVYEATMIEAVAAAFTCAETGAGTEISTTANARLVIDTDANGDAIVSVTDVAGASGKTVYCTAELIPASGTHTYGAAALVPLTFD